MRLQKGEHSARLFFFGLIIALAYLGVLVPAGFLEGARLRSFDSFCRWHNAFFSPPPQTQNLLLVTLDEESQRHLGKKWPWDRGVLADFLTQLNAAEPRVVAFDLVLSGSSDPKHDRALAQAIQSTSTRTPVILASYLDRKGDPVLPDVLFTESGGIPGLINKPRDTDLTVRQLFAGIRIPLREEPLFATEVISAALYQGISLNELRMDRNLRGLQMGSLRIPLWPPVGIMPVNYLIRTSQIPTVSFWQVAQGQVTPETMRDKLIIVGSAQEITHDVYPTSLGVMPGVMISANGILTILARQFLEPLPLWIAAIGGFLLALAVLFATYSLSFMPGFLATLFLIGAGVGTTFLGLVVLHWKTESLSIILLGAAAWLTALLYKHLLLVWETLRLHRLVVTDPVTGVFTGRYFRLRLEQTLGHARRRGDPSIGLLVVQTDRFSDLVQQMPLEEAQTKIRAVAKALRTLQKTALLGHLSEDRFGVLLQKTAAADLIPQLTELLKSFQEHLGMGLAFADQKIFDSPMELLHRAETACARSWKKGVRTVELYDPKLDQGMRPSPNEPAAEDAANSLADVASELEQRNLLLERTLNELRNAHQELEGHFLDVTKSLIMAMDTKDAYTAGHLERVSRYATRLAEVVQLEKQEVEAVKEAALLHDIGKLNLPDEILHKTGTLTQDEVDVIKKHLELGAKILDPMKFFRPITRILYHHHERYDGKGYPHSLTGEFIPPGAQIVAIADSFDAMTTNRSYNKPKTVQEALE